MRAVRPLLTVVAAAAATLALAGPASADPATAATRVWQVGGSNMGECSAFLAGLGVRGDVNQMIKDFGPVLGVSSPGDLYSVRARQAVNLPPAAECLPRNLPAA